MTAALMAEPSKEAVEAAFLALRDTRACRESHRRDDASAAVAAALPLIRAQIAAEIEATGRYGKANGCGQAWWRAINDAADVVRDPRRLPPNGPWWRNKSPEATA